VRSASLLAVENTPPRYLFLFAWAWKELKKELKKKL
jgi:hypothetical protein